MILSVLFLPLCLQPASAASAVDLPRPLDAEAALVERYWGWLKAEVGAPEDLPWPVIDVAPLPRTVRMAFQYPTSRAPWHDLRIIMSPRSVDRAAGSDRLVVVGELAHELVHYVLILSENGWDLSLPHYSDEAHDHCSAEFMRLNRQVGRFIWDVYHSNDTVRSIDHMVHLACWRDAHRVVLNRDIRALEP